MAAIVEHSIPDFSTDQLDGSLSTLIGGRSNVLQFRNSRREVKWDGRASPPRPPASEAMTVETRKDGGCRAAARAAESSVTTDDFDMLGNSP